MESAIEICMAQQQHPCQQRFEEDQRILMKVCIRSILSEIYEVPNESRTVYSVITLLKIAANFLEIKVAEELSGAVKHRNLPKHTACNASHLFELQ